MEINTVCGFLCLASAFFIRKKKNPASNFLDAQEMTCGRGWGGLLWLDNPPLVFWLCYPLSPPAGCMHWIWEMNFMWLKLCHTFPPAALQNCYLILTSLPPAPYHLTSFWLSYALGKAAGQSTVLSGEGFHRRHCLTTTRKHKTETQMIWEFCTKLMFSREG